MPDLSQYNVEELKRIARGGSATPDLSSYSVEELKAIAKGEPTAPEASKREPFNLGRYLVEKVAEPTIEAGVSLGAGLGLYGPSVLYGAAGIAAGRDPRIAEEEMARLAPEPRTELGRRAVEPVSRAFEIGLTPARKIGEGVEKVLGPEAGWVAEKIAELVTFKGVHGLGRGAKARLRGPQPGEPGWTTPKGRAEVARKGLEIEKLEELRREPTRIDLLREAERGLERRVGPGEIPGGAPEIARAMREAEAFREGALVPRGERALARVGPEPEYIPEAEIAPRGLLPPPEGRGPGFEFREPVIRRREPPYRAVEEPVEYPPVYERRGKVVARRPPTREELRADKIRAAEMAAKRREPPKPPVIIEKETPRAKIEHEVKQHVDVAIAADKAGRVKIAEKATQKARANAERVKLANGPEIEKLVNEQLGRLPKIEDISDLDVARMSKSEYAELPKRIQNRIEKKYKEGHKSLVRTGIYEGYELPDKAIDSYPDLRKLYNKQHQIVAVKEGVTILEPIDEAPAIIEIPKKDKLAGIGNIPFIRTLQKEYGFSLSDAHKLVQDYRYGRITQRDVRARLAGKRIKPEKPPAKLKEPWEMTYDWLDGKQSWEVSRAEFIHKMPDKLTKAIATPAHEMDVKNAVKAGKPVPAKVLAEYPELKAAGAKLKVAEKPIGEMTEGELQTEYAKRGYNVAVKPGGRYQITDKNKPLRGVFKIYAKERLANIEKTIQEFEEYAAKAEARLPSQLPKPEKPKVEAKAKKPTVEEEIIGLTYKQWRQEIARATRGERDKGIKKYWPKEELKQATAKYEKIADRVGGELQKLNAFGDKYYPQNYTKAQQKKIERWQEQYNKALGDDRRASEALLRDYFGKLQEGFKAAKPEIKVTGPVKAKEVKVEPTRAERVFEEKGAEFHPTIRLKEGTKAELLREVETRKKAVVDSPKTAELIKDLKRAVEEEKFLEADALFEEIKAEAGTVTFVSKKGVTEYSIPRTNFHLEAFHKGWRGKKATGVTLESLGFQTAYEKVADIIRKRKEEKPMSRQEANKFKRDVHITAKNVWGNQFKNEYEAFKEQMFGRKVSARDLSPQELRQLKSGLSELQTTIGMHVKGSKTRIVKERIVRSAPKKRLPVKGLVVGQEYTSSSGLKWTVLSKDKEGVVVQNQKGLKKKWPIDRTLTLAEKVGKDLKAPAISEYESSGIRQGPELRTRWPLGGWTENPIRVFEELGRFWKEELYNKMRGAEVTAKKEFFSLNKEFKKAKKGLGYKSQKRIGAYAVAQQRNGKNILNAMGIKEVPELTAKEMKAYKWMRENFESLYTRLNEARMEAGKEPFGKVDDYFTFMRVFSLRERMGWTPHESGAAKAFAEKYQQFVAKHFKTTPFRFAKERKAARREVRLDAFNIFNTYAESALPHIHKSPLISRGREYLLKFPDGFELKQIKPNTAKFISQWLDAAAGQRIQFLPRPIELGLSKLNTNLTFAVLSANIRSALIQPSAWVNTVTEIGPRYAMEGVSGIFSPATRKQIMSKSALITRQYDIAVREAMEGLTGKIGAVKKVVGAAALKPLGLLDMETAMASWWGAYQKALKVDKLSESRARIYADDVVTKTQASALEIDLAPIQRTAVGRTLSLFQTFVINNWNFLLRDVAGIKNPRIKRVEAAKKIATWVGGATLVNILYEDVLQIPSPLPTPIRAFIEEYEKEQSVPAASLKVAREIGELVPILGGGIRYGTHPFGAIAQLGSDISAKLADRPGPKRPWYDIIGRLAGIPGTAQYGKTARRLEWGYGPAEALIGRGRGKTVTTRTRRRRTRPTRPRRTR